MTQFFEVETGTEPSPALEKRLLSTARAVVELSTKLGLTPPQRMRLLIPVKEVEADDDWDELALIKGGKSPAG
jgi:phage terminase small subunit